MGAEGWVRYRNTLYGIAAIITASLLAIYLILPVWLGRYVEKQVTTFTQYRASFSHISVSLKNQSYSVHNARLTRKDKNGEIEFIEADQIEVGIIPTGWLTLNFTGKIIAHSPHISFAYSGKNSRTPLTIDDPFRRLGSRLLPVALEELIVIGGQISFRDVDAAPHITLEMNDIEIHARGLSRKPHTDNGLVAFAQGKANIYGGKLKFSVNFNPANPTPEFNMKARLDNLDLSYLSEYLTTHGNYSVEKGLFSVMAEATGDEENVSGFVKPLLATIRLASNRENEKFHAYRTQNFFSRPYPQVSFHGSIQYASLTIWSAVAFTLRNAFFEALMPVIHKIETREGRSHDRPRARRPAPTPAA
jgi:hypothetical protein